MNVINELYKELDEQRFIQFRKMTEQIIVFRVLKDEAITRDIFLEKLYDYIDIVNRENHINTRKMEYLTIYSKALLSLVEKGIEKNSRQEKYFSRAKEIENQLKSKEGNKVELLKDLTRIFVCLYRTTKGNTFSFKIYEADLENTVKMLVDEKGDKSLFRKEKKLINENDRYGEMQYVLVMFELIFLSILSVKPEVEVLA
ncbi:MAG: hypothetical protein ACI32N_07825 [Bulleidia sp.]